MILQSFSIVRMVPMATVMGTIFFLSHQPGDQLALPDVFLLDKIGHFILYAMLAMSAISVPAAVVKKRRPKTFIGSLVLFCFLFAVSDEYHQSFIAGRYASIDDLLADCVGILFVCLLWLKQRYWA